MQEIYAKFEKMGFENISSETPFAAPMKEIALAKLLCKDLTNNH